jgi:integrase
MATISETKAGTFRVLVRRKGAKTACKTFKTRAEADRWARQAESAIDLGRSPSAPNGATVAQAIEAYQELREMGARPIEPQSNEVYMLRHLERELGDDRVANLTPKRIAQYCTKRKKDGAGPYTIGMEVSKLGTALKYARITLGEDWGDPVAQARPLLDHLALVGPGKARERRISSDEETALRAVMPAMLRDIYDLAVLTCMRRGEFVRLEWRDVDQEKRLLTIRDRKHPRQREGHTDVIPLLGNALEILMLQAKGDGPIFPVSPEWISDQFLLACKVARIEDLHFHDLRHEAVSRLFEMGYTIEQVALVSGHRSWSMLKRYTNLRPEQFHAIDPGKPRDPPRHKTDDLRPGTSGA